MIRETDAHGRVQRLDDDPSRDKGKYADYQGAEALNQEKFGVAIEKPVGPDREVARVHLARLAESAEHARHEDRGLEGVALAVAVVQPGDRREAPVDDAHAALGRAGLRWRSADCRYRKL